MKDELSAVEKADMNGQPIEDSFARVGYAKDAEYAINEQVKSVTPPPMHLHSSYVCPGQLLVPVILQL